MLSPGEGFVGEIYDVRLKVLAGFGLAEETT